MAIKPFLMGSEVEYSMSGRQPQTRVRRMRYHRSLVKAITKDHKSLPDIRDVSGIYIDNGARYYLDSGCHNEFSSPELFTPRQVAVYDRAAETILLRAESEVAADADGAGLRITKNNLNFCSPDEAAWGQHEAYTCWIPILSAAQQLIPHLVSRIPYAGAGCLSGHPQGMGFELSQRARHMRRQIGAETQRDRAIFCTRVWKPSDSSAAGWTRTNLISKDSQRASFGMYLTFGVTGLLLLIMNEGHQVGRAVELADPVAAMRTFSLDPWLQTSVPLANGKHATAIDIQRAYLREAAPFVESGDYPEWTVELLTHWSQTLDQLDSDPLAMASRLDAYLKLATFDHRITRAGLSWSVLRRALLVLGKLRKTMEPDELGTCLVEDPDTLEDAQRTWFEMLAKRAELPGVPLESLRLAQRMQAFELNYHELGGWFDRLAAAGHVDPVVVSSAEVERALHHPPPGGRAEARSKSIAEFHGEPWHCDWQYVINTQQKVWVDLRDPFSNRREVSPVEPVSRPGVPRPEPGDLW